MLNNKSINKINDINIYEIINNYKEISRIINNEIERDLNNNNSCKISKNKINDFLILNDESFFKLSDEDVKRTLRTHPHVPHLDEIAGLVILLMCDNIRCKGNIPILVRTRNEKIINSKGGIAFDVSRKYDFNKNEQDKFGITDTTQYFDHHQNDFNVKWDKNHSNRMATFGLIFKNYGNIAIRDFLNKINEDLDFFDDKKINKIVNNIYSGWGKIIDCVDNGECKLNVYIKESDDILKKEWLIDRTSLYQRIKNLYPNWNSCNPDWDSCFIKAYNLVKKELVDEILINVKKVKDYSLKKALLSKSYNNRIKFHNSGKILYLSKYFPYLSILNKLENGNGNILFVIFLDDNGCKYSIQCIRSSNNNTGYRKLLNDRFFGYKYDNEEKNCLDGRNDIEFVHSNGFIGGSKSLEGAIFLCENSFN